MIYLDASAIVTDVLKREHSGALLRHLQSQPIGSVGTSTVGFIEVVRNCDRVGTFPRLMGHLVREYSEFRLTDQVRDRAADLAGRLKTLDAIHVATAETLGDELISFVTYDQQMATVARSCGLPVASPGIDL